MRSKSQPICLGIPSGGICALEASLLTSNICKLILYEPLSVPFAGSPVYREGFIDRLEMLLEAGDRDAVLTDFYHEIAGMDSEEIEQVKTSPLWPERLAIASTLPRELRADHQYVFDAQRFAHMYIPTLLLEGGNSRDFEKRGNQILEAALPTSRIQVMPGQGHIAMYTGPDLFIREMLRFITEPGATN